jgi:hypothetical protein
MKTCTTTIMLCLLLAVASCKKEKTITPVEATIAVNNFTKWKTTATNVWETEAVLSDADYTRITAAASTPTVEFKLNAVLQPLPFTSINNDVVSTYFHKWENKTLKIYRQFNKLTLIAEVQPTDATVKLLEWPK